MTIRERQSIVISISTNMPHYRVSLPRFGVIEQIILRTYATPPQRIALVLNNAHRPIDLSWDALRLLRLSTAWGQEQRARLLYTEGDLLELVLDTSRFNTIEIAYTGAEGLQEIIYDRRYSSTP